MRTCHTCKCPVAYCRFTFFACIPKRPDGLKHESTRGAEKRLGSSDFNLDGGVIPKSLRRTDWSLGFGSLYQIINCGPGDTQRNAEDRGIEDGH
jgi:hypothetical protein